MTTTIENVARAAAWKRFKATCMPPNEDATTPGMQLRFDTYFNTHRSAFIAEQSAAITALREPTEEMIDAGANTPQMQLVNGAIQLAKLRGADFKSLGMSKSDSAIANAWRAMIDSILEEKP